MVNKWIEHVKKYAKDNNVTYACAISEAKKTYVKVDKELEKKKRSEVNKKLKLKSLLKDYKEAKDQEKELEVIRIKYSDFPKAMKDYFKENAPKFVKLIENKD